MSVPLNREISSRIFQKKKAQFCSNLVELIFYLIVTLKLVPVYICMYYYVNSAEKHICMYIQNKCACNKLNKNKKGGESSIKFFNTFLRVNIQY